MCSALPPIPSKRGNSAKVNLCSSAETRTRILTTTDSSWSISTRLWRRWFTLIAMISRHLPLVTNRIRFSPTLPSPTALITPRIDFGAIGAISKSQTPLKHQARELTPSDHGLSEIGDTHLDDEGESEIGSDAEETELSALSFKKIPKPSGEPGRPRSGGYSIEAALASWDKKEFSDVNVN